MEKKGRAVAMGKRVDSDRMKLRFGDGVVGVAAAWWWILDSVCTVAVPHRHDNGRGPVNKKKAHAQPQRVAHGETAKMAAGWRAVEFIARREAKIYGLPAVLQL